jgi:hypothetical protein
MAIGAPVIVRKPGMTVEYDNNGTPTVVDIGCAVRSLTFDRNEEIIDLPTFCSPEQTAVGKSSTSATVAVYWSDDLVEALTPHLGQVGEFHVKYNDADTKETVFSGKIESIPFGTITPGEAIEADLTIAVTVPPTRVDVTP